MRESTKITDISSDEELLDVEKQLIDLGLLRFAWIRKNKNELGKNKEDILYNILRANKGHNTLFTKNGRRQCDVNRNRSQGDLFRIMKYYCDDLTLKEFRSILYKLINSKKILTFYCSNINKIVNLTPDWEDDEDPGEETTLRISSDCTPADWVSDCKGRATQTWHGQYYIEFKLQDELGLKAQIE